MKEKFKRFLAVLLSICMVCTLAVNAVGCGKKEDDPDDDKPPVLTEWEDFKDSEVKNADVKMSHFPNMPTLEKVYSVDYNFGLEKVIDKGEEVFGEMITLSALQGLIMKNSTAKEGIYLNVLSCGGFADGFSQVWLDTLLAEGLTKETVVQNVNAANGTEKSALVQLITKFKNSIAKTESGKHGYILYKQVITDGVDPEGNPRKIGSQCVNAALTAAGVTGFLPIDERLVGILEEVGGFEQALDVREWTEIDAFDAFKDKISRNLISLTPSAYAENRDLGVMAGMFFMDESLADNDFMNKQFQTVFPFNSGAIMMGWGSGGEVDQIRKFGSYGLGFLCTVYNYNLTAFMSLGRKELRQRNEDKALTADPKKHYVAMIMTDGDNISWHQNDFIFNKAYLGYSMNKSERAKNPFKMGYTTSPTLVDLAPNIMKYEYSKSSPYDYFYAGTSGSQIIYPTTYGETNSESLNKLAVSTNEYMRRSGIEYTEILDDIPFDDDVLNAYASQSDIKGGFVLANYNKYIQDGDLKWYNNKPFLGVAESFWNDTAGKVAYRLNSLKPSINTVDGYTLMTVHCWTTPMEIVANMVKKLDSHIEIVSPGELMKMIEKNVPKTDAERTQFGDINYPDGVDEYIDAEFMYTNTPINEKTQFNFDTFKDYEGWQKWIGPKVYDNISFSGEPWKYSTNVRTTADFGSGYSVRMDGGDYGLTDNSPSCSIYSKLKVPDSDKAIFRFFTRCEGYGFDSDFRTRVVYKDGDSYKIELLKTGLEYSTGQVEWTVNGDHLWKETVYDVSKFKAKEVVFVIEHNSTAGEGDGEIMYIDNISVGTDTLDTAVISSASSNSKYTASFDTGVDGYQNYTSNGGSAGYSLERKALTAVTGSAQNSGADVVFFTNYKLTPSNYTQYKYGVNVRTESGTAWGRVGLIASNGKVYRGSQYRQITSQQNYLIFDCDTYSMKGSGFATVRPFIEITGSGNSTTVYVENASFAPYTMDYENGYYFDKDFILNRDKVEVTSLNNISSWTLESGRGLEDEAIIEDGKIRLYGYDFMRIKDDVLVSKKIGNYSKVKNEYNARMFANVTFTNQTSLSFSATKVPRTKSGDLTTAAQYRVLFLSGDGTVTQLKGYSSISSGATQNISVTIPSGVKNKSGAIMIEFDVAGNGMRSGLLIENIAVA